MKKSVLITIRIILAAILLVGLVFLGINFWEDYESRRGHEDALNIATEHQPEAETPPQATQTPDEPKEPTDPEVTVPQPTEAPVPQVPTYTDPTIDELRAIEMAPLREVNPDVIGWIHIPNSRISYPIIQGEDNAYYLRRSWDDQKSSAGCIFMEAQNTADFNDFNTIIYGHNLRSKNMFGTLSKFSSENYWEAHPSVYIINDNGVYRYDIFAAHKTTLSTIIYRVNIKDEDQKDELIRFSKDYSVIDTGLTPTVDDHILTLSTCTNNQNYKTRWIVQAYLNEQESYIIAK